MAEERDIFGTWWRGGENEAELKRRCPWIKGVHIGYPWEALEPGCEAFDWDTFDGTLGRYADAGYCILFMILVGPHSPRWIYDIGVPEVHTTPTLNPRGVPHGWTYPYYLDERYKHHYHRMIREVARHIDELPAGVRERIVCIQTAEGTTGDEGGYKGNPLDSRYELPEAEWRAFKFETWKLFDRLYRPKAPRIHLLINSGNRAQYHDWLMANIPDVWRKAGNPGHGYQLNNERDMMAFLDPIINRPDGEGNVVRCRSEMDETFKGWFREAPVWNMYWLNLWGLHFGLDILQHQTTAFEDRRHDEGFAFYSRYGGHKDPAKSPGAWCALRDGLDAADTERFPVEVFGGGELDPQREDQREGIERCLSIVRAFAGYGARQGDPEKAMQVVMQNRSAKAMNDVGWNIHAGNYRRFLTQHDPNGTSRGYWRVGPKDQPYGRFARGFDHAGGRDAMFFRLDEGFFPGAPDLGRKAKLRVVYFDSGSGGWALKYDAMGDPQKTACTVRKADSGRWKEAVVTVEDGYFGRRCPHDTDLMLVNTDAEDDLFHMVELVRCD